MKKIALILAFLAVLGIGAFIFVTAQKLKQTGITVLRESGSVMAKSADGEYKEIGDGEVTIANHSFVKTGANGLAEVILPDKSMISFDKSTEMQINYEENGTNIIEQVGKAWFRVQKLGGKREFNVTSPTAVASVRGTIFGVETGEEAVLYVTESTVEIAKLVDENGTKVKKGVVNLEANKLATIGAEDTAVIVDIPEEKRNTPWFKRNEIINREFLKGSNPHDFLKNIINSEEIKALDQVIIGAGDASTLGTETTALNGLDFLGNYRELCNLYTGEEFQTGIAQLRQIPAYSWLADFVTDVRSYCSDGALSDTEAAELGQKYEARAKESTSLMPKIPALDGVTLPEIGQ